MCTENEVGLGNKPPGTGAEDAVGQEDQGIEDIYGCECQLLCPRDALVIPPDEPYDHQVLGEDYGILPGDTERDLFMPAVPSVVRVYQYLYKIYS